MVAEFDELIFFKENTIHHLRDFILDNKISDTDSVSLSTEAFDEIALDYWNTYREHMEQPFIFLGVWVKPAAIMSLKNNQAGIVYDDPAPTPVSEKQAITYGKEYRCGWCGKLVDESGKELEGEAWQRAADRGNKFGDDIFIKTTGKCCEHRRHGN